MDNQTAEHLADSATREQEREERRRRADESKEKKEEGRKRQSEMIDDFLDGGKTVEIPLRTRGYYGGMMAYMLQQVIKEDGWEVTRMLGEGDGADPRYRQVSLGPDKSVSVLGKGGLFLVRGEERLAVLIMSMPATMLIAYAAEEQREIAELFVAGIRLRMKEQNIYRGGNISFDGYIRFLQLEKRNWEDLALDPAKKHEIENNSVRLLRHNAELKKYGIPCKRGIILAGVPGTGKTLISKVLMNNSPDITCIEAHPSLVENPGFIYDIYELARDLRPCILFLEDVDLVGYDRDRSGYSRGAGLASLLNELDGAEDCHGIVTVAMTNNLKSLDKALVNRPSRFDRVIIMELPEIRERRYQIGRISKRIPLSENLQEYLAQHTDGYSPAQIQDILQSIIINRLGDEKDLENEPFTRDEVDRAMASIYGKSNRKSMGFAARGGEHNADKSEGENAETGLAA
jgi:cell division protease FtsH